jgi:hypothetical protein
MRSRSAYDRVMDKVVIDEVTGCWIFQGAKNSSAYHAGHGQIRVKKNGKWGKALAHRISYEHHFGPIPKDKVVRHTCDNGRCVCPQHFELGSVQDNNYDIALRQRGANQYGPYTSFVEMTEEAPF